MDIQSYRELVGHVREGITTHVPADATVLVVSKGDEDLVELRSRRGWHFPQTDAGEYAGAYPANAALAVEHLEDLRLRGAEYLVFPKTAFWWLDYYQGFREHLESEYSTLFRDQTCIVFDLRSRLGEGRLDRGGPPTDASPSRAVTPLRPAGSPVIVATMSPPGSSTGLGRRPARRANVEVELAAVLAESAADLTAAAVASLHSIGTANAALGLTAPSDPLEKGLLRDKDKSWRGCSMMTAQALYVRSLSLLLVRGWVGANAPPRLARLRRGAEEVLACSDVWYPRTDVRLEAGVQAYGYAVSALLKPKEEDRFTVDCFTASGFVIETQIERIDEIECFEVRLPAVPAGDPLADLVLPAKQLLDAIAGEPHWLAHLRKEPAMRHIVASERNLLLDDIRSSEHLAHIAHELFDWTLDQLVARGPDGLRPVRKKIAAALEADAAGDPAANSFIAELAGRLERNEVYTEDRKALNSLLISAVKGREAIRGAMSASTSLRGGLLGILASADGAPAGLRLAAAGAQSAVLDAAARAWDGRGSFDEALAAAVLGWPGLAALMKDEPRVATALTSNGPALDRICLQPAVQNSVLTRCGPSLPGLEWRALNDAGQPESKRESTRASRLTRPRALNRAGQWGLRKDVKFSVVMAVYNGAEFLAETLESVRSQAYSHYDVIVVDDASTDATREILSAFAAGDDRTSIITHSVNLGQAAAFNTGISAATGEYVALLDADDLWFPEKLSVCARFIAMHNGVDFLQHNLKLLIGEERSERLFRPTLASGDYIQQMRDSNSYFPGPFTPTAGLVFSKRLLDRVLPIPTALRICADGFLTRASAALTQVASTPAPLGYYRLHGANATVGNDDYDVKGYTSRVLAPLLQDFYNRLERPIKLAKFKDSRHLTRIEVRRDARFGVETEFDVRFRDAVRFVFLGIQPTVRFTSPFIRFLERCRVLIDRSDFDGLLDEGFGRRALPDAEDPLAIMIEALMRWHVGEWSKMTELLSTVQYAAADSIAVAVCESAAAEKTQNEGAKSALRRRHARTGRLTLSHVERAVERDIVRQDPAGFLDLLRAAVDARGHDAGYFDADDWIVETAQTVSAWKSEFIGNGMPAKLFADRRLPPPPQVAEAVDAYMRGLTSTGGLGAPGADWSSAAASDLPGAHVFCGEWQIRSAEGALVTDGYERAPLVVSSAYGRIWPHEPLAHLVTSPNVREVGAVYVLGGDGGYGAWVLDVLPRALWFAQDPRGEGMRGLLARSSGAFQGEFLERLGLSADRVIEVPFPSVCFADRVVLPLIGPACSEFRACYGPVRRWAHDHAGALFYEGYSVVPWTRTEQGRRVFVRQDPSEPRVLIREDETAALFAEAGFEVVQAADLSVGEQVRLFNEAAVVVGPNGASLANLCFCRPETQVMELAFSAWPSNRLQAAATGRGLRHQRFYLRAASCFQSSDKEEAGYLDPGRIGALLARLPAGGNR